MSEDHSAVLRGYAEQCLACARTAFDDGSRAKWLEMAQGWFAAAETAEVRLQQQQQQQLQPVRIHPTKSSLE
jgi:hypothetical protein